jgi:predicted phage gp36 major capsid-like protein
MARFDQCFVLVDRWPVSIELVANLFGQNLRPVGSRGLFMYARTGSDVVMSNAARLLNAT